MQDAAPPVVTQLLQSLLQRTQSYFQQEFGVVFTVQPAQALQQADLSTDSAIIGLQGSVNLWVAFSPVPALSTLIYAQMTADFEVAPNEVTQFREAAMAEMANTVLGHCTADLQTGSRIALPMTPPLVLTAPKQIARQGAARLHGLRLSTAAGHLDILIAGPANLFQPNLDYQE